MECVPGLKWRYGIWRAFPPPPLSLQNGDATERIVRERGRMFQAEARWESIGRMERLQKAFIATDSNFTWRSGWNVRHAVDAVLDIEKVQEACNTRSKGEKGHKIVPYAYIINRYLYFIHYPCLNMGLPTTTAEWNEICIKPEDISSTRDTKVPIRRLLSFPVEWMGDTVPYSPQDRKERKYKWREGRRPSQRIFKGSHWL